MQHRMSTASRALCAWFLLAGTCLAQGDGWLHRDGRSLFALGFYELPADEAGLRAMAEAGVNLVRCHSAAELDRAAAAGLMGWVPLPVQQGATEQLRALVTSVRDHPALAVWEGPDEIVWHFTAASVLEQSAGIRGDDWRAQRPNAVEYARARAAELMPRLRDGVALVRALDPHDRQFWMNEARESDAQYVREYVDWVDIIGCDDYPVKAGRATDLGRPLRAADFWRQVGRGKPVWMVLQAFSWDEIGRGDATRYPSFDESRFMAYGAIAHGARGLLYWGSNYLKSDEFRQSLYALTRELAALQPFLVAAPIEGVAVTLIEPRDAPAGPGVRAWARRYGRDWVVALVNEDAARHMGVEVCGLGHIEGAPLELLYGGETVTVRGGAFVTRMQPFDVKVFATSRRWEADRREGRDYGREAEPGAAR